MGDILEQKTCVGREAKALGDQILALVRDEIVEAEVGGADLLVRLKGDVAADHVIEEDPEGPDGGLVAVVLVALDPFGGRVDSGTCERKK